MKEARIIMPTAEHVRDAHKAHRDIRHQLATLFGGCTVTQGVGDWLDGDKLISEDVMIYDVASSKTGPWADQQLIDIALAAGAKLRQKAVYVRGFSGDVDIIDVRAARGSDSDGEEPMPEINQLWRTRDGSIVAVHDRASANSEPFKFKCVVVKARDGSRYPVEYVAVVDKYGKFNPHASSPHPLDLIERVYGY